MNILAVLLPLLMSLMVGFGAIRIIQMMHQIIHGRSDIGTGMLDHLSSRVGNLKGPGGAGDSPLASTLASLNNAGANLPGSDVSDIVGGTGSAGEGTKGGEAGGSASASIPGSGVGDTSGMNSQPSPSGSASDVDEGASAHLENEDDASGSPTDAATPLSSPDSPGGGSGDKAEADALAGASAGAAMETAGSQDTSAATGAKKPGNLFMRSAGRAIGTYRQAPDFFHKRFDKPLRKYRVLKAYAKSSTPAYVAKALLMGGLTDAPHAMAVLRPQYMADHKFRRQQMRSAAHRLVDDRFGPYIPSPPPTASSAGATESMANSNYGNRGQRPSPPSATQSNTASARNASPEQGPSDPPSGGFDPPDTPPPGSYDNGGV